MTCIFRSLRRCVRVEAMLVVAWAALLPAACFSQGSTAAGSSKFRHQSATAYDAGEACLAIYWARSAPHCTHEHIHELTPQTPGEQAGFRDLLSAARTMRVSSAWMETRYSSDDASRSRAQQLLAKALKNADACLLELERPAHWVLIWSDGDQVGLLDPQGAPVTRKYTAAAIAKRWPIGRDGRWRCLPLKGRVAAPLPQLAAHSRFQYARTVRSLQARAEQLREEAETDSQAPFTVLVERPFVVVGDASPAEMRRWAEGTIRWAVKRMKAQYFEKDPETVLAIWLFDGKASYNRNAETLFGREPTTPYGYYSPRNQALVMNIQTGGGTLVHEILHPFMEANFPRCPSWFNEGLASLYEQSTERDSEIWGLTNWRLAGLQRAVASSGIPTFKQLCETTSSEFYGDKTGVHYAQARYLCYYLQEQGKLQAYYRRFLKQRSEDPSGYATLTHVLDEDDMKAFEARWKKYVLGLRYPE